MVGEYDIWSIKWGYTWFYDVEEADDENEVLHDWIVANGDDPLYFFEYANGSDPRSQTEAIGDAMEASELGIANLERITGNLIEWIEEPGQDFDDLAELYSNVISQWRRYMGHVTTYIGGVYRPIKHLTRMELYMKLSTIRSTAVDAPSEYAFSTPTWAFNRDILDRINESTAVELSVQLNQIYNGY